MKRLLFAACALFLLGACAVEEEVVTQDIGGVYINGIFVAYCSEEVAPTLFTKEGFPIIDDQACIPEPEVLGVIVTVGGPDGPAVVCTEEPCDEVPDCTEEPCDEVPDCTEEPCDEVPDECENANPGNGKCVGNSGENPNSRPGWNENPGTTGQSGGGGQGGGGQGGGGQGGGPPEGKGKPSSKGLDHLSAAEQAFMLWDYNNRVDYEAYWQWMLDNGLVIAE